MRGLPNHLDFSTPSTVKRAGITSSPYFGDCCSTSIPKLRATPGSQQEYTRYVVPIPFPPQPPACSSFPNCPPHLCQHPPWQHQTLAANSHQSSSAKAANHRQVQGWLGNERTEHSTEQHPDTGRNAKQTCSSHVPALPLTARTESGRLQK